MSSKEELDKLKETFGDAVIVVGAGLSGASCALTILENGGKVILVEKAKLGGNSVRASSGLNASETKAQDDQGVEDSNELFAKDTAYSMFKVRGAKPTPLVSTLCNESASAVQFVEDHNLSIPVLSQCGGHSAPRTHRPTSGAAGGYITMGILRAVKKYEKKGKLKILKKTRMMKILPGRYGNVNGIATRRVRSDYDSATGMLRAACVVIATGGFCYNKEMLKKYAPHYANLGTTNGPWAQGQGMTLCTEVGAKLLDMECVQVHPTGFIDPVKPDEHEKVLAAECLRASGALLINAKGYRFVNELGHRDDVTAAERGQIGKIRIILNPATVKEVAPHVNMYIKFFGVLKKYKNGAALAKAMRIPVENLKDTFATYNESARKGWCPSGKTRFPAIPYSMDQELVVGHVAPVLHYVMGGVKIDTQARVIDTSGKPIRGLFACGETTGGVHGRNRLAGNSLVDCVVYGRIAGRSACKYLGIKKSNL